MEPVEKQRLRISYAIYTKVNDIKCLGQEPDTNWFVHFDGSRESINFGNGHPSFNIGDKIKITFERIEDAIPTETPKQ